MDEKTEILPIVRVFNHCDVDHVISQVRSNAVKLFVSPKVLKMLHCRCTYMWEGAKGSEVIYKNANVIVDKRLKHKQVIAIRGGG